MKGESCQLTVDLQPTSGEGVIEHPTSTGVMCAQYEDPQAGFLTSKSVVINQIPYGIV